MVPPWASEVPQALPGLEAINPEVLGLEADPPGEEAAPAAPLVVQVAPPARFLGARRAFGEYARSGDLGSIRRGLGHYVRTGYGGARTAQRRMGRTASTAGALYAAFASLANGQPVAPGSPLDPAILAGRSAREVIDAVIEAVRPTDGTQDAEASRAAISDALSELLTMFPGADLLNLDELQRGFVVERYTAIDVFRRLDLDLGKTIREKAPNATTALSRIKQVRDYVKETVAASFRRLRNQGRPITAGRVSEVVREALHETFQVFEGYAE
jgi:hypothetical protein